MTSTLDDRLARVGIAVLGAYMLLLGTVAFLAPGAFYDTLGPYGAENHHYARDVGTFHLAFGVLALAAVPRPGWHAPVLLLAVVQFALHTVSHLIDVDEADPGWLGPFALVGLALATVLLAALALRRRRAGA